MLSILGVEDHLLSIGKQSGVRTSDSMSANTRSLFQDKEPRGIIPLENVQVREVQDKTRPNCFEIYSVNCSIIKACKTDSDGKVVEGMCSFLGSGSLGGLVPKGPVGSRVPMIIMDAGTLDLSAIGHKQCRLFRKAQRLPHVGSHA